ncbi:MAG: hypothetical protein Q8L16_12080, partial [Hydrogenophaga sp.]|nr:hypothetical protein [Hydrogenophaga sp.]
MRTAAAGARIAVLASLVWAWGAAAQPLVVGKPDHPPGEAHHAWTQASTDSRQVAAWVMRSGDN